MRLFATLLRIAESLDRSHQDFVSQARFGEGKRDEVVLEIYANQDIQLELWGVQNHSRSFEKVFRKKLKIQVL